MRNDLYEVSHHVVLALEELLFLLDERQEEGQQDAEDSEYDVRNHVWPLCVHARVEELDSDVLSIYSQHLLIWKELKQF